jgi:hypothetical protein
MTRSKNLRICSHALRHSFEMQVMAVGGSHLKHATRKLAPGIYSGIKPRWPSGKRYRTSLETGNISG